MFGKAKNGALNAQKIGVANKTFLKNAPLIDKWNREGLINSKVDYGVAKNAFLKRQRGVLDHRPVGDRHAQEERLKFRIVQMPKIKFRSVPFLGVQGFLVTRFASTHGVAAGRRTSSAQLHGDGGVAV